MDTAVSIPDDLFERAEQRAAALGMSRDEFYTAALTNLVGEESDEGITERLNEVYAEHSSELDPAFGRTPPTPPGEEPAGYSGGVQDRRRRAGQHARDLEIINRQYASLNREAEDVLMFQSEP